MPSTSTKDSRATNKSERKKSEISPKDAWKVHHFEFLDRILHFYAWQCMKIPNPMVKSRKNNHLFACVWAHVLKTVCVVCVRHMAADIKRKEEKEICRQKEKTEVHLFDTESLRKCKGMSSMPCVSVRARVWIQLMILWKHWGMAFKERYGEKQLMGQSHTRTRR